MAKPKIRCAIYTRKSTDEGLDQSFNSLDAQRDSCESYVSSQKHEGWAALPAHYDDGGYSGGSMDRPGLQKLIGDIKARRVDTVVVYKVDRLTRLLSDFAKMVDLFDRHNVTFVSVTQQFSTVNSMGRLTLNVLLSFAQFEREITTERIRDKVAASKAKGMWMGGAVPLGYKAHGRTLILIPEEAEIIRHIFQRYVVLKSPRKLQAELKRDGILTKNYISQSGQQKGGNNFSRGSLYMLLQNPLYIGQIRHRDKCYPGLHERIVSEELWQDVQKTVKSTLAEHTIRLRKNLLAGILFDSSGARFTVTNTLKGDKRHSYYVLSQGREKTGERLWLSMDEINRLILNRLSLHVAQTKPTNQHELQAALNSADPCVQSDTVKLIVKKIVIYHNMISVRLLDQNMITIDYHFTTFGRNKNIIAPEINEQAPEKQKQSILKSYLLGVIWRRELFGSSDGTIETIAKKYRKSISYVTQLINFSFMAPDLASNILKGDIPEGITLKNLLHNWPESWVEQRRRFSISSTF